MVNQRNEKDSSLDFIRVERNIEIVEAVGGKQSPDGGCIDVVAENTVEEVDNLFVDVGLKSEGRRFLFCSVLIDMNILNRFPKQILAAPGGDISQDAVGCENQRHMLVDETQIPDINTSLV